MCFELLLLHTPAELIYDMIEREKMIHVNLVDIGKISPKGPQFGVKLDLNTHF